ncbi:5'/3'-nucleotidase SurE [Endozoicomonas sp. (ex Bugula neritina AB1)]|nr:5'/3'-nucleotidase SurE [Endozoicomonas sp. (ex Bugula neritina AB1)]
MTILLSNDDGVTAPGLRHLFKVLSPLADCRVFAPDNDCSGAGSSLTLSRPLRVKDHDNGFLSVDGTPTDAVHLAINSLLSEAPERVISGINLGANLGDDVLYSETVAAAMEGRFMERPSVAISSCGKTELDLEVAARVMADLYPSLNDLKLPAGTILNVNVPACAYADIKGMKVTRLGHRVRPEAPVEVTDPRGKQAYWIAPVGRAQDGGEGTDFHAVASGYVSVTPLQYDKTDHGTLSLVNQWLVD